MRDVTDFTTMPVGKILLRTATFTQRIELCPVCKLPGKPRYCPGGRQFVHAARVVRGGLVAYTATTRACIVPQ